MVRGEGTVTWTTLLCLLLSLIPYITGLSDTIARPHLPRGCTPKNVPGGKKIECSNAAFHDVVSACAVLGDALVEIIIEGCSPKPPVKLTSSTFNSSKLREVQITDCSVYYLADDALKKLVNLRVLNLSSNEIFRLTSKSLTGLSMLENLYLRKNRVDNIGCDTFVGLQQLTRLYLGQNRLTVICPRTFTALVNLKELSLEDNLIQRFTNGSLHPLKKLQFLNLTSNRISHIDEDTFHGNRRLEELHLKYNGMTFGYVSVRMLEYLTRLRKLVLSWNPLFISGRYVQVDVFLKDQANSLTHLDLSGTYFTNQHFAMLKNLKSLKYLRLVDNHIGFIQKSSLPKLANLDVRLNENKILYVDENAFEGSKTVHLEQNPFDCSCSLRGFSRWLRTRKGSVVFDRKKLKCGGPVGMFGTNVMDYDPYWWSCSSYVPLVGLVFVIAFGLLVALVALLVYCNLVNIKHCLLERREASKVSDEERILPTTCGESDPLLNNNVLSRNSLRLGKTGAYILYDMYETQVLKWVNKYIEDQLYNHPMRITLQWSAGPEVIPLWKQIKDFSFQVNYFLVIVTEEFLEKHWPDIAEKSGVENVMKCVLVLHGKKISELPKEIRRLKCPSFEWPQDGNGAQRKRLRFWKQIRLALKGMLK